MKKLNLSLLAILITVAVMPQSAFSMEQQPSLKEAWDEYRSARYLGFGAVKKIDGRYYYWASTRQEVLPREGIQTITTWKPLPEGPMPLDIINTKTYNSGCPSDETALEAPRMMSTEK